MRNRKILTISAAFVLGMSSLSVQAQAAPASSGTTTGTEGSSDAEIAGLAIGIIAATLALASGAGFFAIQQGITPNPLPGIIPGPKPAAPAAQVRSGQACGAHQASQPTHGADGWLVCTFMGDGNFRWVHGPVPQGRGTAHQGGYCRDGEQGGQDQQGRMMMCISNQWVYGP